jgi:NarL family two-component system response regulator YdfI
VIRVQIIASGIARAGIASLLRESPRIELADAGADVLIVEAHGDELPEQAQAEAGVAVILLADDPPWIAEAFRAGVRAVLPRELSAAEIVAAVEAAAVGLVVVHPQELEGILPAAPVAPPHLAEALSPREIEVLGMMAEGIANKEIAVRLAISEHTVKFHVASIMGKLHAGTRTEAVMLGVRMGLVLV